MSDYLGLRPIAERLGVSRNTVLAWRRDRSFLMYRRRIGPRFVWYTNDRLIETWEIAMCRAEPQTRPKAPRTAGHGRS